MENTLGMRSLVFLFRCSVPLFRYSVFSSIPIKMLKHGCLYLQAIELVETMEGPKQLGLTADKGNGNLGLRLPTASEVHCFQCSFISISVPMHVFTDPVHKNIKTKPFAGIKYTTFNTLTLGIILDGRSSFPGEVMLPWQHHSHSYMLAR